MNKDDYNKLIEELSKIHERLSEQETRLKRIEKPSVEMPLRKVTPKKEPSRVELDKRAELLSLESNIGKYVLQVVGAIIFIAGSGLFLKYSIEQGWLSPLVRVVGALCLSGLLIALSEYVRVHRTYWSFASLTGGLVLAYLAVFAAHVYYALIPFSVAYIGFALISAATLYFSYKRDSQFIALMSLIIGSASLGGGFFAHYPYIMILGSGALILALMKRWKILAVMSFTIPLLSLWTASRAWGYPELLIVTFLPFNLITLMYWIYKESKDNLLESFIIPASTFLGYFIAITYFIHPGGSSQRFVEGVISGLFGSSYRYGQEVSICTIFGLFFFLEYLFLVSKKRRCSAISMALFTLAVTFFSGILVLPLQSFLLFDQSVAGFFAFLLVGLAVAALATQTKQSYSFWGLFGLLLIWSFSSTIVEDYSVVLVVSSLAALVLSAIYVIGMYLFGDTCDSDLGYPLSEYLSAGAVSTPLFLSLICSSNGWFIPYTALFTAAYGSLVLFGGYLYDRLSVAYVGFAGLVLSLIYALYYYIPLFTKIFPRLKPLSLGQYTVLLGGLFLIFAFLYGLMLLSKKQPKDVAYKRLRTFVVIGSFITIFLLVRTLLLYGVHYYQAVITSKSILDSIKGLIATGKLTSRELAQSPGYKNYVLSVYYGLVGLFLIIGGFIWKKPPVRLAGLLFLSITAWLLAWDTGYGLAKIIATVVGGCILMAASYLYQYRMKE